MDTFYLVNIAVKLSLAERADISKTTFYYHYDDIYSVAEEFENELTEQLSDAFSRLGKADTSTAFDFEYYTKGIIDFLKENEESYRMVIKASSPRLFVEKLKKTVAKQITENIARLPFSAVPEIRQVQVCFISSACVDVVVEYFMGSFSALFDTVTDVILEIIKKLSADVDNTYINTNSIKNHL